MPDPGGGRADPVVALVGRARALVWAGLAALALGAWAYLLSLQSGMADMPGMRPALTSWSRVDLVFAVAMWAVMMVGMMLPAAAPVILLFAAVNRNRRERGGVAVRTAVFLLGYFAVWGGFSVAAALAQGGLQAVALLSPTLRTTSPLLGGALLLGAGAYQLSPLKTVCLAHCRSPLGFFMTRWRDGASGAFAMGIRHGAYCLGCCWVLMGLLFVAGVMNLLWVAGIAALVLLEKVAPGGVLIGRVASVALIGAGLVMVGRAAGLLPG